MEMRQLVDLLVLDEVSELGGAITRHQFECIAGCPHALIQKVLHQFIRKEVALRKIPSFQQRD